MPACPWRKEIQWYEEDGWPQQICSAWLCLFFRCGVLISFPGAVTKSPGLGERGLLLAHSPGHRPSRQWGSTDRSLGVIMLLLSAGMHPCAQLLSPLLNSSGADAWGTRLSTWMAMSSCHSAQVVVRGQLWGVRFSFSFLEIQLGLWALVVSGWATSPASFSLLSKINIVLMENLNSLKWKLFWKSE